MRCNLLHHARTPLLRRFGVCCLFVLQESGTVRENCTYVQNDGFPTPLGADNADDVQFTVERCSEGQISQSGSRGGGSQPVGWPREGRDDDGQ